VRARYDFALIGYVFMPDHVRLLMGRLFGVVEFNHGYDGNRTEHW